MKSLTTDGEGDTRRSSSSYIDAVDRRHTLESLEAIQRGRHIELDRIKRKLANAHVRNGT